MQNCRFLLLAFVLLGAFSACKSVQEPEFKAFKNLRVLDSNSDYIEIAADAVLFNPNVFGINLSGAEFEVTISDEKLGVIQQNEAANIKAGEEFVYPMKARVDLGNLTKGFLGKLGKALTIFAEGEMDMLVEGHFVVQVMNKDIRIPFSHREKVPIK